MIRKEVRILAGLVGERHNRKHGIHARCLRGDAAVTDEEIFDKVAQAIELLGTEVAPMVRREMAKASRV